MLLLTELAKLVCAHEIGVVDIAATQTLVTVEGKRVLVEANPESRGIDGCPMYGALVKPCKLTLAVKQGYSDLLRIDGLRMCLDTVTGLTDGTPPGMVFYHVNFAGQQFVAEHS